MEITKWQDQCSRGYVRTLGRFVQSSLLRERSHRRGSTWQIFYTTGSSVVRVESFAL